MATKKLEQLSARGEKLVAKLVGVKKPTAKKAPFDVVDFGDGIAYEVKTVTTLALSGSNKIHIGKGAWERKQAFMQEYGLEGALIVVVIASRNDVSVYRTELKQHLRISSAIKNGIRIA